jgi:hypothetical protein
MGIGAGLGYRTALHASLFRYRQQVPVVEIVTDHFLGAPSAAFDALDLLKQGFRVIPHGLDLSIGTATGIDRRYLEAVAAVVSRVEPPWWSDHLAMTRAGGIEIGHLAPLVRTTDQLKVVLRNLKTVQSVISTPLLLENITWSVDLPGHTLSEADFLRRVVEESGCGILLDVTNAYINARNRNQEPRAFVDALPLERVVQLHAAGGREEDDELIDSHSEPTPAPVWALARHVCERAPVQCIIIERDANFPRFDRLLEEVGVAQSLLHNTPEFLGWPTSTTSGDHVVHSLVAQQKTQARLYVDELYRQAYDWADLPRSSMERYAEALYRKRYHEIKQLLPVTTQTLAPEGFRLFRRHAERFVPRGPQRHVHDALAWVRTLTSLPPDARQEIRRLERTWAFRPSGVQPRRPWFSLSR